MLLLGYILVVLAIASAIPTKERMPAAARRLLERMNLNIDPCEDFYQYACGGQLDSVVIQPDNIEAGTIQMQVDTVNRQLQRLLGSPIRRKDIQPVKKAKLFYRSCVNTREVEANAVSQVLAYLNSDGGTWPTFDSSWDESTFDLELSMAFAQRQSNTDDPGPLPLIQMQVDRNLFSSEYLLSFRRPIFGIGDQDFIADNLELLGADRATAEADATDMLALNNLLAGLLDTGFATGLVQDMYTIPGTFDWLKYLRAVFKETDYVVTSSVTVQLYPFDYYVGLITALNNADQRTLSNLIKWRMFMSLRRALPLAFQQRHLERIQPITGQEVLSKRAEFCAQIVSGGNSGVYGMSQAVARMYVQKFFLKKDKVENERLTDIQVDTFAELLENNDWLSEETRATFLSKLRKYKNSRVYPNTTFDNGYLENYYRDFNIKKGCYADNYISSLTGNVRRSLEEIIVPEPLRWDVSAVVVNAFANFQRVTTVVTAAILTDPMYHRSFPLAVKAGAGGSVSSHELAHILGYSGSFWDENGFVDPSFMRNLSATSEAEFFGPRATCLIDQYNQYEIPFTDGLTVNGAQSLEENYADSMGLKIAYLAYEKIIEKIGEQRIRTLPFTAREIFFISYAQAYCEAFRPEFAEFLAVFSSYSPGEWRAKGPLRNLPEFAEIFNCPAGSFMNPAERCTFY